ncbi:MAG: hypothetical protein QOH84_6271 [Kribbellaceae bacterium]|jgi:hypothetical protein|nr:hypothetical protein [Kribbellaceae bacterium]
MVLPLRKEPTINDEIQLISDGDGLAVIGESAVVDRFLASEGLLATRDFGLPTLRGAMSAGATAAEAGSGIAANSGRWVKLTKESAELVKKHGLRESKSGLKTGVVKGSKGQVKTFVQFMKGPSTALTNPAVLAGAAGVMAQVAMRQTMDEITDYLATIDEKVDDVLRSQKDAVLARMIGLGLVIEETLTIREHGGRVNEVTWSKVQAAPATIAETQAYALRQIDALADKLESKRKFADLAEAAEQAEQKAQEWLAVLARCWQLQDAIAVLELDRVFDAAPDDLDGHRLGLKAARQDRLELLSRTTERLTARLDAAAALANTKVLMHPAKSRDVVQASNHVGTAVRELHGRLGINAGRQTVEARRWADAAAQVRAKALETGGDGVEAARRLGKGTVRTVKSAAGEVSRRVGEGPVLRRGPSDGGDEQI